MLMVNAQQVAEGDGSFMVDRVFPADGIVAVDPFLLLDHFGPRDVPAGQAARLPPHPHRGFETFTYMLDGRLQHADTAGHDGIVGPGEVQWMTAGSGIIHSEQPEPQFQSAGGRFHGIQLWINLPAADKMTAPKYQELQGDDLPVVSLPDAAGTARILAGSLFGATAAGHSFTPLQIAHMKLRPGARLHVPVTAGFTTAFYVLQGAAEIDGTAVNAKSMAVPGFAGDAPFAVSAAADGADVLLLAGAPIGEPIARGGPFVMNTREEVLQAFDDYRNGRLHVAAARAID